MDPLLEKYFPGLSVDQKKKFEHLEELYISWNARVNLISRTDISHLYERHILHSLAIANFIRFNKGTRVMDLGTGGGFPGIPLAIFFPEASFTLVDSISKKIKVVSDVISELKISNAAAVCSRAEETTGSFDYVVSRATAPLNELYKWSRKLISKTQINAIPNGIICLKGGDLTLELKPFLGRTEVTPVSLYFDEPFFETKQVVFLAV